MCEDEGYVTKPYYGLWLILAILAILVSFHMVISFTTYKSRSYAYTLVISYIM